MRPSSSRMMMPCLPAGFRFHPTDEELIVHYLMNQAASVPCPVPIIAEVNIYHCNPWDLPPKALFGENEWYFFSPRDRKYPNGARPNRAAGSGYWKATGTDKAILSSSSSPTSQSHQSVGVKKALVFYRGKPPRGVKTDWVMHEYRLTNNSGTNKRASGSGSSSLSMRLDDWVLCRIYKKSSNNFQLASDHELHDGSTAEEDDEAPSLNNKSNNGGAPSSPKSEEEAAAAHQHTAAGDEHEHHHQSFFPPTPNPTMNMNMSMTKSCSLTDLLSTIDYSTLSQLLLDAPPPPAETESAEPQISMLPQADALPCAEYYGASIYYYNNNSLKRKRVMTTTTTDAAAANSSSSSTGCYFDDDGGTGLKRKLVQMTTTSDASATTTRSSGNLVFGGYCNQQLVAEAAGSSSTFQYSGLPGHNPPFLIKNQQLLLHNHHLEMQMQ